MIIETGSPLHKDRTLALLAKGREQKRILYNIFMPCHEPEKGGNPCGPVRRRDLPRLETPLSHFPYEQKTDLLKHRSRQSPYPCISVGGLIKLRPSHPHFGRYGLAGVFGLETGRQGCRYRIAGGSMSASSTSNRKGNKRNET